MSETSNVLDKIAAYKREEIAKAKSERSFAQLIEATRHMPPARGFIAALEQARKQKRPGLIAEIKKASPSKGLIRADFDPATLARAYEQGGATCLSVLTDGPSFQGAPEYLAAARDAVALPVLRKDFILETYQVLESRALGADCILIILAMVSDGTAANLQIAARDWGVDVLMEVHDEAELKRALNLRAPMIGINNRDLKTFHTDIATSARLAPLIPTDTLVVAESGLSEAEDLRTLAKAGITTYLIGESLMRQDDVATATRTLLNDGAL